MDSTSGQNSLGNSFVQCISLNNAGITEAIGAYTQPTMLTNSEIMNCSLIRDFSTGVGSAAAGIRHQGTGAGGSCAVIDSQCLNNSGSTNALSFGLDILPTNSTGNLLTQNIAFNNGNVLANQMNRVIASNTTATAGINSTSIPELTNVGVAG